MSLYNLPNFPKSLPSCVKIPISQGVGNMLSGVINMRAASIVTSLISVSIFLSLSLPFILIIGFIKADECEAFQNKDL